MQNLGYASIPNSLVYWTTFLLEALPLRSIPCFIELFFGAMISPGGCVTQAYLSVTMTNHWTSYYKWLQEGCWSWLGLVRQFVQLTLSLVNDPVVYLAIDDTLTLRASKKAPCSQIHHQHGRKVNLSDYVQAQCWVNLSCVLKIGNQTTSIPWVSRFVSSQSNTNKLETAKVLIRSVITYLTQRKVRVLVDSWYMRSTFVQYALGKGLHVIGQTRIDTALYDLPPKHDGKRGRPKKYGDKYTAQRIGPLKRTVYEPFLYGKKQKVRYRSRVVLCRFMKGLMVRAVWCELLGANGEWTKTRLLISTDPTLTPEQMIEDYSLRWSIEPMFNQLKNAWGLKQAWQQTHRVLHRWFHIKTVGYGVLQLLRCFEEQSALELCQHSGWRKENIVTAGQIRIGLRRILMHVKVRDWWSRKAQKIVPKILR